jgi:hypothetical protein
MTADGLSRAYPTLELVERWGVLNVINPDGTPKRYDDVVELTQGLEPRLLGTVYFPGTTLRGLKFDVRRGIYPSFSGTAAAEVAKPDNQRTMLTASGQDAKYKDMQIIGMTGISTSTDQWSRTGFYVRKYIDFRRPQSEVGLFTSTTHWIEFRYAEVLLNRAEAAVETGKTEDAMNCVNLLRTRGGGATLSLGEVNVESVRNERCKELAFENHYWWDIRRWRTADVILNNQRFKGLLPYYVYDEQKFIMLREQETFGRNYNFEKRAYYEPIPGGELAKNPNLYPNNPNY